jgi:colanic acid biosynthesis protein WcaH
MLIYFLLKTDRTIILKIQTNCKTGQKYQEVIDYLAMNAKRTPDKLKKDRLVQVIKLAPLVSIDLIIENGKGQVLLGMRKNEPARGFWFVPGGRIFKNERILHALKRIAKNELGLKLNYDKAEFIGAFEHIYKTNFAKKTGFGTHYVVLAHRIKQNCDFDIISDNQHSELVWFDKQQILKNKKVHANAKAYFKREQ